MPATKSRMKSQTITVALIDGIEQVKAMCVSGLGLHRATSDPGMWSLTHVESGWRVALFSTRSAAQRALNALLPITDWTAGKDALLKTTKDGYTFGLIRQAIKTNGGSL